MDEDGWLDDFDYEPEFEPDPLDAWYDDDDLHEETLDSDEEYCYDYVDDQADAWAHQD